MSGRLRLFAGPLHDNTGGLRVAAGEAMSDEALLAFDWLVQGVTGVVPR